MGRGKPLEQLPVPVVVRSNPTAREVRGELPREVLGVAVAPGRLRMECTVGDGRELGGSFGDEILDGVEFPLARILQDVIRRRPQEGRSPGEQLVETGAQTEDV